MGAEVGSKVKMGAEVGRASTEADKGSGVERGREQKIELDNGEVIKDEKTHRVEQCVRRRALCTHEGAACHYVC
jgi:hypothetical protein